MKLIENALGSFFTGDRVAGAVMAYHAALVARREVDLISIPVLDKNGNGVVAAVAIGWLTGLQAHHGFSTQGDVDAPGVVADLRAKAAAIHH